MNISRATWVPALLVTVTLAGCASPGYYPATQQSYPAYPTPVRTHPASSPAYTQLYGTVDSIQIQQAPADVGVGAVVGGVVGGLLGNRVGGGSGRKVATVAGVVGGAMMGHQMERNAQMRDVYQIGIRLDDGSYQTLSQDSVADLQVGSRVRLENGRAYRY